MVALFVLFTFAGFIAIDMILNKNAWARVMKEAPGTIELPQDAMYDIPEVGLTMADGKPEDEENEEKK